ncbi:MAG: hypothetical protein RBS07_18945 [Lentimicrobium sp.]|jgi:hypothetical protein|nr:hypothetical protein [Lentimicrobium sp.]
MKKIIAFFVFTFIPVVMFAQINYANYQDVVYLKNGNVIRGIILEQVPNESLKIETNEGSVSVVQMSDVEKIAKEKIPEIQQVKPEEEELLTEQDETVIANKDYRSTFSAGFMMGGGNLVGFDFEVWLGKRFGFQAGTGVAAGSFGLGLNYHLQDRINSSFLSLVYWQQGVFDNHYASYVGPFFTLRLKRLLQAGVGLGYVVDKGPAIYGTKYENMDVALLFNLGLYFSF